ncbi:hypothetical protein GCM10009740_39130 [Terrabacter terrae]|uniref:YbaB/EbfC DNA-binding family protein n=1 Tax=Terrabacter terrae TaxID=318434 RepID=A0ABP4KHA1_9MICO
MTEPTQIRSVVGDADAALDRRLSDELDAVNAAATAGTPAGRELTVRLLDADGDLVAGLSGWTRRVAAGIGMEHAAQVSLTSSGWTAMTRTGVGLGPRHRP